MQFADEHAHLVLLCVRPAQQRRGIGRRLHEWLVASARVAGIASIRLELRADNAAALAFYQGLGFAETQWVPDYYDGRVAARRMSLPLRGGHEPAFGRSSGGQDPPRGGVSLLWRNALARSSSIGRTSNDRPQADAGISAAMRAASSRLRPR